MGGRRPHFNQAAQVVAPFAELPRSTPSTTWSAPAGVVWNCDTAGDFTTALAGCVGGDWIKLNKANTFTGTFTLRNLAGTTPVYITSSDASFQVAGSTVPTSGTNMPKIVSAGSPNIAIKTNSNAHDYRFVGLEIYNTATATGGLFRIGNGETTVATLPRRITIDRCYIHGDDAAESVRGVQMDGIDIAVINSLVINFKSTGADTQALWAYNTPGPLLIQNNHLEATGENFMMGGADPTIANCTVSDVTFQGNYVKKLSTWVNTSYIIKNLFESKMSARVLVQNNVFDGCWKPSSGQSGFALNIKTANQDGTATWAQTRDMTVCYNKFINCESWLALSDKDPNTSLTTTLFYAYHNLVLLSAPYNSNSTPGDGRVVMMLGNLVDVKIQFNTCLILASSTGSSGEFISYTDGSVATKMVNINILDNIFSKGDIGWDGPVSTEGTSSLDYHCSSYSFLRNAIIGSSATYPATNIKPADNATAITDVAGGNYVVKAAGPCDNTGLDGVDMGANIGVVQALALLAGV